MKILILNDYSFIEGGAGKVAIESAVGLAKKGHEIIFFSAVGPVCSELEKSKIKEIICLNQKDILSSENKISASLSGIKNRFAIKNLKDLFVTWKPDIVHAHGVSKALSWAVIGYIFREKIPVVYTLHDFGLLCPNMGLYDFKNRRQCELYKSGTYFKCLITNCDKRSYVQKLWRWARFFYTRNIIKVRKKISGYIAVSIFVADFFKNFLPEQARLKVIYNPVKSKFAENRDIESGSGIKTRFLYAGRLSAEKGIGLLLEAIREVDAKLVMIGEGELYDYCKEVSKQLGKNKVEILKWQGDEEKIRLIQESDAIILPSLVMETAGIALLEAKEYGTPAIVSNHGAFREFVKDNEDGLFFEAGSKDSLVRAMQKIIKEPGLVKILGKNARINFKDYKGQIDSHINNLEQFYLEVINST